MVHGHLIESLLNIIMFELSFNIIMNDFLFTEMFGISVISTEVELYFGGFLSLTEIY